MNRYLYVQRTGELLRNDTVLCVGYAGFGVGKNDPMMQTVKDVGPLPCGIYRIGNAYTHDLLGPLTMDLKPDPANEMFGRDFFRIHGDSTHNPGNASHGCIVAPHEIRQFIADHLADGDRLLEVVADRNIAPLEA